MFQRFSSTLRELRRAVLLIPVLLLCATAMQSLAQTGALLHTNTNSNNRKSNQNKSWYHDGKWWAIAPDDSKNAEYIWRYDGNGIWTRMSTKLDKGNLNHYDVFMDSQTGELAIVRSHTKYVKFRRYLYEGGNWDLKASTQLYNFGNTDNNNPCSLVKAKNGEYWIFQILDSKLMARYSSDGGATWIPKFAISPKILNTARGTTAAVSFARFGNNLLGVAYGEIGGGAANTQYGFFFHRETDAYNVWIDETSFLPVIGNESGNNNISLASTADGVVYMFTRNIGGNQASPRNTLYKRTANKQWAAFPVNLTGDAWKWNSPAVAVDTSNQIVIVGGIRVDSSFAEYKYVALGSEAQLQTAPRGVLMQNGTNTFEELNFPRQMVSSLSGLMMTAGNATQNKTWFNVFYKNPVVPILVHTVRVDTNEANARGRYTIPLRLTDLVSGALTAGVSTISIRFTETVGVPVSIAPGHVTVNGVAATAVSTAPLAKEIMITPAVNIGGADSVTVIIDSLASVLNMQKPGWDSLQVWTSAQQIPIQSPAFAIIMATTKVKPATVTMVPTLPGSPAAYRIGFRVGNHGRMSAGQDTFRLAFNLDTKVSDGPLAGVLVNSIAANATADSVARKIEIQLPASLSLTNNDTLRMDFPAHILSNPLLAGFYSMLVSTNVETSLVVSKLYEIGGVDTCGTPIPGTTGTFARGNQSKSFYHDGIWWIIAQAQADGDWYLWQFNGIGWVQSIKISEFSKDRPDAWLESSSNRAYLLLPGTTTTMFSRLNYSGGAWSIASGYPKTVNSVQNDEMALVRAPNGDFWVSWTADSSVWVQRSANEGSSWFPAVAIKKMHVINGLTDAVPLSGGIGLGFAENSSNAAARYGFLLHSDGAPDSVWTDESETKLGPIHPSSTSSDNHVQLMTVNNEVFMTVKTKGGSGSSTTKNALFHRTSGGSWSRYDIIQGNGWTRPIAALDVTNNVYYVLGIREGAAKNIEMKRVSFGDYDDLLSAPIDTVLCNLPNNFFDITLPMHTVNGTSNLMVVAENESTDRLWFRLLDFSLLGVPKAGQPAQEYTELTGLIDDYKLSASVYPNPFNPRTAIKFTIPQASKVKLQIFNLNGQLVRTLVNRELPSGAHEQRWNARDENGRSVASGTYLYRLQVGANVLTGNMQLLK